ncbi:MAG: glycosyl hydrolase 53 family protein [Oscillospiraceae bacterium]|nr:glycosyl hydrolase 53 family protein [Oscillospiraceae bacterium]
MKKTWIALLLLPALLLAACGGSPAQTQEKTESPEESAETVESSLYVKKVEDLPEDFILGMDVSSLIAEEQSGVRYFDFDGEEKDLLEILAENGVTHIRVRVWNEPYDEEGRGFGGGNCDIDKALAIGQRAAQYGLKLIVDFHYSDFWADPGKQMAPRAWADMDVETKAEALYAYTKESLQKLMDGGADIAMVQVGNETNGALCGEDRWSNIQLLMKAGSRAIREVCPQALVAMHFANPERSGSYANYAEYLDYYEVDYDVFASSYYSFWHGTRQNLARVLGDIHQLYGKQVMVMETSWPYTGEDSDFSGNNVGDGSGLQLDYPFTVQAQANSVRDVADTVAHIPGGIGLCYWEGAWISVGTESWEQNSPLWEQFGSGWASSYAAAYDPDDAGKYYGGCSWDNQTFFDPTGHPLESLRVFRLLKQGNELPLRPDAIEDTSITVDLAGELSMPETVNAVMSDNSREAIPVEWELNDALRQQMFSGGPAVYEVMGQAQGMDAKCLVNMVEFNYLENGDFEAGALEPWTVTERGKADQLYVENKLGDSLDGKWHMHFWSAKENSVDFSLEQTVTDLAPGSYRFSISIMGGDCGETEIYAYALVDGELVATAPLTVTVWDSWDTGKIPGIRVEEGQNVTVGIFVKCQGAGNGAWGKIDAAMLNAEG